MQMIFKVVSRGADYIRGLFIYLIIRLAGGECIGIPRIGKNTYFKYPPHRGYKIGKNLNIGPGCYFDVPPSGRIIVGDNVKLTTQIVISAIDIVSIGDDTLIAEFCTIRDAEHSYEIDHKISSQDLVSAPISIGQDVWIGRNCTILRNTTISNGCVVGANSFLKKCTLESHTVYAGTPIKKIRNRISSNVA